MRPSREAYPADHSGPAHSATGPLDTATALAQLLHWASVEIGIIGDSHSTANGTITEPHIAKEVQEVRDWIEKLNGARVLTERQYAALTSDKLQACDLQARINEVLQEASELRQDALAIEAREQRYLAAIRWALGEAGDFNPPDPIYAGKFVAVAGRYWWRRELRHRAGLLYSPAQGHSIDPEAP